MGFIYRLRSFCNVRCLINLIQLTHSKNIPSLFTIFDRENYNFLFHFLKPFCSKDMLQKYVKHVIFLNGRSLFGSSIPCKEKKNQTGWLRPSLACASCSKLLASHFDSETKCSDKDLNINFVIWSWCSWTKLELQNFRAYNGSTLVFRIHWIFCYL